MPILATQGAASARGFGLTTSLADRVFIEDVFSTYLYTGTAPTDQTINNGIDLAGKGGMVWFKGRNTAADDSSHIVVDTVRGRSSTIKTYTTNAPVTSSAGVDLVSFNSNGFTVGSAEQLSLNNSGLPTNYASWTFREQPKFFDVVTYAGTGSAQNIAHNLGSVPGMIIVKRTDTTANWAVYHRSLANTQYLVLNSTAVAATGATWWNSTTPTSSVFSLGTDASVNASGGTYVAYIYAHNAGGFGTTGTDNVISCDSFVADGSGIADVNLGYEPQYVMIKSSTTADQWQIFDVMRGWSQTGGAWLNANSSAAESTWSGTVFYPTATGFHYEFGVSGQTYIYMAIRRPMKVPTDATTVFKPDYNASFPQPGTVTTNFVADWDIYKRTSGGATIGGTRLTSGNYLFLDGTDAESAGSLFLWGSNTSFIAQYLTSSGESTINWAFRRASGFFDIVCYTGTGTPSQNVNHNLTVIPELIIIKSRSNDNPWIVRTPAIISAGQYLSLNSSDPATNDTVQGYTYSGQPTATIFKAGLYNNNIGGSFYVAYLFATCAGVSKVGSYTGTGATQTINCGFTGGARFVLIKRTDFAGAWYVWDTARGIVSGNDPYLLLNSTNAEVTNTDFIDPASSGFEISSTAPAAINASGGSFIFLAVA